MPNPNQRTETVIGATGSVLGDGKSNHASSLRLGKITACSPTTFPASVTSREKVLRQHGLITLRHSL